MMWVPSLIILLGALLIVAAIILDFYSANKSQKRDNVSARQSSNTAGWLSIIGLILIVFGLIVANIMYRSVTTAVMTTVPQSAYGIR